MRDLGIMGESAFKGWCGDVGLIPNGSQIDKTGWDFIVEFPFDTEADLAEIDKATLECRIQVKATDKKNRERSVTLSNLRRLATAPMPAFFVFIEFDGHTDAQRAFVVHVDNILISKVLKRLHKINQSEKRNKLNRRVMTIHYDDSHMMDSLTGGCLKNTLEGYIGNDLSLYIKNKNSHVKSTGFEKGFDQITVTTEGKENLKKLVDVSIGLEKSVQVKHFRGIRTRFGIANNAPFVDSNGGRLEMPDLKHKEAIVRFSDDKFEPSLSFSSKLYVSPFINIVPDEYKKIRLESEFFDMIVNPFTGKVSSSFSVGEGIRLEIHEFRKALKLLTKLNTIGNRLQFEIDVSNNKIFESKIKCIEHNYSFSKELNTLDRAVNIISDFDVTDCIDISLEEISNYEDEIRNMESLLRSSPDTYEIKFNIDGEGFDPSKEVACILFVMAPIGSHFFGVFFVAIGKVTMHGKESVRLIPKDVITEKKIVSERDGSIRKDDIDKATRNIEKKYDKNYSVVTLFKGGSN